MKIFKKLLLPALMILTAGGFQARGDDGGVPVITGHYWFDQEKDVKVLQPGHSLIPVEKLSDGIHVFNAQVQKDGIPSSPFSRWFVKTSQPTPSSTVEVEFDIDGKPWQTVRSSASNHFLSLSIDASALPEGFHYLYGTVKIDGNRSVTYGRMFIKTLSLNTGQEYKVATFVDGMPFRTVSQIATSDGVLSLPLDMNGVGLGLHSLQLQIIGPSGVPSATKETLFVRLPTSAQLATMEGQYVLDGQTAGVMKPSVDGNTYHLDLDVSQLNSGLHTLSFYMASPEGLITSMKTEWFIKTPAGGEGVKSYDYWINDNLSTIRSVTLDKVTNPLQILKLIDVPQEPFRTSSFTFAVENGQPVVYAKQDFQIRFSDPDGRITSGTTPFTDVRERIAVTDLKSVVDPHNSYRENIGDDKIKWYTIQGEQGDSVSFRLSGAGMAELFGPDGKLLVERSGVNATASASATLPANGTHYLAVHDIASNSKNVDVLVDVIPKFAILEFTPEASSNEDLLLATLKGNGFDSIQSLCLKGDAGTIECAEIVKVDNYECLAVFRFDDNPENIGNYSFVGTFKDKEKGETHTIVTSKQLSLAAGQPVDIAVSIETPRIARTPYQVNVKVENRSNRGHYGVPLNIAVKDFSEGCFGPINFLFVCDPEDDTLPYYRIDNLLGTGQSGVYLPLIIPYLAPNETKIFTLGYVTKPHEKVSMYAWNGTPWSEDVKILSSKDNWTIEEIDSHLEYHHLSVFDIVKIYDTLLSGKDDSSYFVDSTINSLLKHIGTIKKDPDDIPTPSNPINTSVDGAISRAKNVLEIAGIESSRANRGDLKVSDALLEQDPMLENFYKTSGAKDLDDNKRELTGISEDCLIKAGQTDDDLRGHGESLRYLIEGKNRLDAYFNERTSSPKIVDCYQSGDPNELHGYTSPSGDNSVGIDVKELGYSIEFENDPEIANAAATRINVTNVLAGKQFDLTSFTPKKMIIGKKEVDLPASHHFVKTLDMRPEINSVAELTFDYDIHSGKAEWNIVTLDPMTLQPTRYMDDGILPVNDDSGRGTGFLTYSVNLRPGLAHDTAIENQAIIIFDDNTPIPTPVYVNVTDYTRPVAKILSVETEDNKSFTIEVEGTDSGSGIWYYDLYMNRQGTEDWIPVMNQIEEDFFVYSSETPLTGVDFAVVAIDKAGNRQLVSFLNKLAGDADNNGSVDANDVVLTRNYYTGKTTAINKENADVTMDGIIDTQDATGIRNIYLDHKVKLKTVRLTRK